MSDYQQIPIQIPVGINSDDTALAAAPAWMASSGFRFRDGKAQVKGGFESLFSSLLTGVCRSIFPWTDTSPQNTLNVAFATHSNLQLYQGGSVYDITPFGPVTPIGANPITVVNGSPTISITQTAHGYSTGNSLNLYGSTSVGRLSLDGTYSITVINPNTWQFTFGANASVAKTLAAATPLSTLISSAVVTVTEAAHNIANGTSVAFSGAAAVGGITPNGTFPITVIDANTYSYTFTSAATSTATGGGAAVVATVPTTGGGSAIVIDPQVLLPAGQIDGTGSSGYGTGAFGSGAFGLPSAADYFPRTWSLSSFGQILMACPRGQTIFEWKNVIANRALPVLNAPTQVTYALVSEQNQVFAFGCNQEISGVFNPLCIRHSDIRNELGWSSIATSSSTSREYVLPGGGRIVAARVMGSYLLVWTTEALWLGTYVGQIGQVWSFDKVGDKCGLAGPNAADVIGSSAFWVSPDRQFHSYQLNGFVRPVTCPIRNDFAKNLAASQSDKIVCSSLAEYNEIRFDYPDTRDGRENSRNLNLCWTGPDAGAWHPGLDARTAVIDAGPTLYSLGTTYAGNAYYMEKGQTANGAALTGFIQTAALYLDPNTVMMVKSFWPDISGQVGNFKVTISGMMFPQGPMTQVGPFTITPGQTEVDFRFKARLVELRYDYSGNPVDGRIGLPMANAKTSGRK